MDTKTLEAFALSGDREAALAALIPGTDEHYALQALHLQHEGRLSESADVVKAWQRARGRTDGVRRAEDRLALLGHGEDPDATVAYVKRELSPSLHHQQRVEGRRTSDPTRLDPERVSTERVLKDARGRRSNLRGIADAGLDLVLDGEIDAGDLRPVLERVTRPDHPRLVHHVAAELADTKRTGGFGALSIHARLTAAQLDALAELRPELRSHARWVEARMAHLHPRFDEPWEEDRERRAAYLDQLWAFVSRLAPAFDGLKVHVLQHRLALDASLGVYDKDRLLTYLRLPFRGSHRSSDWLERHRGRLVTPGQDYRAHTLLGPLADDGELLTEALAHFLREQDGVEPWGEFIHRRFLERLQATEKLLSGAPDSARWTELLADPEALRQLGERVDIDLARTNPEALGANDPVELRAWVKNVKTLVVKVFEIHTPNYYRGRGREVDTALDLDGLVAAVEETHTFDEPPIRRVLRTFPLPALARPGVFVVELLGGGKSSRAVLEKGGLRVVERTGAAGHVFTVTDEGGRHVPDATIVLGGTEHRPDADGEIALPYADSPKRQRLLLCHEGRASLAVFDHRPETYHLDADLHVEREQLVAGMEADVLVRASLSVAGHPVDPSLIEDPRLTITSVDRDGTESTRELPGIELKADRETVHRVRVPEGLARLTLSLKGHVKDLRQRRVELGASRTYTLNGIDATERTSGLHLGRARGGWVLLVLGKSGEPLAHEPVALHLQHRLAVDELSPISLQTDERGRIELGMLDGVTSLRAAVSASGLEERFVLPRPGARLPQVVHAAHGTRVRIAMPLEVRLDYHDVALIERRGDRPTANRLEALSVEPGYLALDVGPGEYDLHVKPLDARVTVRVLEGERTGGWIHGARVALEERPAPPLSITSLALEGEDLVVRLEGAGKRTRVHVAGGRFLPAHPLLDGLAPAGREGPRSRPHRPRLNAYVSGRDLGDEYRYVLERRYQTRFPGNLLARPGLLIQPWAVRDTKAGVQDAAKGGAYRSMAAAPAEGAASWDEAPAPEPQLAGGAFATIDFLKEGGALLANLRPDDDGVVRVPLADLGPAWRVRVVAIDPSRGAIGRELDLDEAPLDPRDRRLLHGLDPEGHFAERREVAILETGGRVSLADVTTSEVEVYDTLAKVHRLFGALTSDPALDTFSFIVRWPELSPEEKLERYDEHACHELNLFLCFKDPEFFERVVRPHLRNKKAKTFLDRYLLGDDLERYLEPWAFGRLNTLERILLGRRLDGDADDRVARHIGDRAELLPKDPEGDAHRFRTAVQRGALETDGLAAEIALRQDALTMAAGAKAMAGLFGATAAAPAAPMAPPMAGGPSRPAAPAPGGGGRGRKKMSRARMADAEVEDKAEEMDLDDLFCEEEEAEEAAEKERGRRETVRQLFQKLDRTQELADTDYWRLRRDETGPDRIPVNAFWADLARHRGEGPFLSRHVAVATSNRTEMLCALAVLGLPFDAVASPSSSFEGAGMHLDVPGGALVFQKDVRPTELAEGAPPILVSQVYLKDSDRYRYEDGERHERYVTGAFVRGEVYACGVVLTNPTASPRKLEVLLQIPRGSMPVRGGFRTRGRLVRLGPYQTERIEYAFYFPAAGRYPHFPVHVAAGERLVGFADARELEVVERLGSDDETSWAWVSQHGSEEAVLAFLDRENIERVDLELLCWRLKDRAFYEKALPALEGRHVYHDRVWAYALLHGDARRLATWLRHQEALMGRAGPALTRGLVELDPVERGWYEHLEYAPLVNARAHQLGKERRILNDRFREQYDAFLRVVCHRPAVGAEDALALATYLLLQDRVEEAIVWLERVADGDVEMRLQLDYLRCYVAFFSAEPEAARPIAEGYADYPVLRWKKLFRTVLAQLDEARGSGVTVVDAKDRDQAQGALAASEPTLELDVEDRMITVHHRGLERVALSYYPMDVELLFSTQPFVQGDTERFSFITPKQRHEHETGASDGALRVPLPDAFQSSNLIVEASAGGLREARAYYAHRLRVQVIEAYGQVQVAHRETGAPLARTYVKVYAREVSGRDRFYKDGYTDLRGRFDYASLSTNALDGVERFALLVLHDEHGAVIREAAPPKR